MATSTRTSFHRVFYVLYKIVPGKHFIPSRACIIYNVYDSVLRVFPNKRSESFASFWKIRTFASANEA